jgi:hypothetical protein
MDKNMIYILPIHAPTIKEVKKAFFIKSDRMVPFR